MQATTKRGTEQRNAARRCAAWALGTLLACCVPMMGMATRAEAATDGAPKKTITKPVAVKPATTKRSVTTSQTAPSTSKNPLLKTSKIAYAPRSAGISCVPYVRSVTGIDVKGNAYAWWDNAAGQYERGSNPEPGAIMNFRATGRMRLGHVAAVTHVTDSRTVEIDHANWGGPGATKGGVSRGIPVIDVSEANDWSSVRVGLGQTGGFGSVYLTYGFIYGRPDRGTMVANATMRRYDEVAEVPDASRFRSTGVITRQIR